MTFGVACIGAGYFGRQQIAAWRGMAGAKLLGVADLDPARAAASGAPAFSDAEEMLERTRPDIVDIAAPPEAHLSLIRLALAARPAAVICQKPFCGSLAKAREAVALAQAAGVALIVHENFRFQPWHRAMRAALAAGEIGRPRQLTFRLRPGDGQGRNAYLARQPRFRAMRRFLIHETGVHFIDLFRFLWGEPESVIADLRRLNPAIAGEDAGFFLLAWADGRRALFDGDRLLDHAAEDRRRTMGEMLAEGDAGAISCGGDGALRLRRFGETAERTIFSPPPTQEFGGGCIRALQAHVLAALEGRGEFENEARHCLRNLEIEAAIYRAHETGARVFF